MLCELAIKNFAIIDDLRINFLDGLTILSGETGAGKSIIINAVNLILGSRATPKLIRTGSETAELEALFRISEKGRVADIMAEKGLDPSEDLLIKRIISAKNRHRIYINGQLATIGQLTAVTENLASISGQHAHQGLLKEEQHLVLLDQFGGLLPLRGKVHKLYHEAVPLMDKLSRLKKKGTRQDEQIELFLFQKNEIEDAKLKKDEDVSLEQERTRLRNGEALYQTVHRGIHELYAGEGSIMESLTGVRKNMEKAAVMDPALSTRAEELDDAAFRIEDITEKLRSYLGEIQLDPAALEEVEERMDLIQKLKRKYGGSLTAVFDHYEKVARELAEMENLEETIREMEKQVSELLDKLLKTASDLSAKRQKAAKRFGKKVEEELGTLEMARTTFEVALHGAGAGISWGDKQICENGMDRAVFMIAPNVGEALKPLAKIASGGELSRVILALKAILAKLDSVETVVFDEVDAGIGGTTADAVGRKLASLSGFHQVICITHLAQIAKFGNQHFKIEKHLEKGRTHTTIDLLDQEQRVREMARIIGGSHMTETTLDHAREMLLRVKPSP